MATQVQIYNLALLKLGEDALTTATDDTVPCDRCNTVYPLALLESLDMGPEKGWRFARWRVNQVALDEKDITAFADYSGTVADTVSATATAHGYVTGDLVTIKDGSVGSYDDDYKITRIDDNSFYFTETWVSTETATAQWTSQEYLYRFARPTCTRVTEVSVGGAEIEDWMREGSWILTNDHDDGTLDMKYIHHSDNLTVTDFPPHFVDVLWRKLAIHLCYGQVQSRSFAEQLITELETVYLPRAVAMDAREQYVKEESSSWVDAGRSTTVIE